MAVFCHIQMMTSGAAKPTHASQLLQARMHSASQAMPAAQALRL
jgi:hypothetical protein